MSNADFVTTLDGRRVEGVITKETDEKVQIDTVVSSIRTTLTFKKSDVYSIIYHPVEENFFGVRQSEKIEKVDSTETNEVADSCLVIPIIGIIGQEVTFDGILACFDYAKRNGIKEIVFEINTPGGSVSEIERIAQVMQDHDMDFNYTAIVYEAISAGIWIAAGCDTIYFFDHSLIGAAAVINVDSNKVATPVDAKTESYTSAKIESIALRKGHEPLLFRAMVVQSETVFITQDRSSGSIKVASSLPVGDQLLIEKIDSEDTILTLTGKKAIQVGLGVPFPTEGLPWKQKGNIGSDIIKQAAERKQREVRNRVARKQAEELRKENLENSIKRDLLKIEAWAEQLDRLVLRAERNDPRAFSDYEVEVVHGTTIRIETTPGTSVVKLRREFNGVVTRRLSLAGMRRWQDRTDACVKEWRDIIAGAKDLAKQVEKYRETAIFDVYSVRIDDIYRLAHDKIDRLLKER
jgi:hypothetical protein